MWTLNPNYLSNGTLAAPAVVLPDVDEDGVRDLAVLAFGDLQVCAMLSCPCLLKEESGDFPGSPVVKTLHFQCRGVQVQSLVEDLRFHIPCRAARK